MWQFGNIEKKLVISSSVCTKSMSLILFLTDKTKTLFKNQPLLSPL